MYTYAFWGLAKWLLYNQLSENIESRSHKDKKSTEQTICWGIKRKKTLKTLVSLSLLFALDAFAGGFVMQTFLSYWFNKRWALDISHLGGMLMITNIISGVSGLVASKLVNLIGAVQTMVLTHLPSNFLLMLIPAMPTQATAVLMLFARSSIAQMDVPARQAYVTMVVDSD
jgi:predicted MFS family arabinose efflux permease